MPTPYKLSGMPRTSVFLVVPTLTLSIPDLRAQIATLAFGFLILAIGLAALALFLFRRKTRDLTLLSLGIAAVSIGAGGQGGGAHTPNEWFHPEGRELGLKRILLTLLLLLRDLEGAPLREPSRNGG